MGDAGMSVQTRRIRDAADQALARMGKPTVHLVGHSFGGWLVANYAVRHPERVASLLLLEPVFLRTSPLNDSQNVASSRGA